MPSHCIISYMLNKYLPAKFEDKWIQEWDEKKIFQAVSPKNKQEKQYVLAMFPYPSGAGLHVGHVRNYTGTDVLARYFRMNGKAVLHPMGFDAFGLPAENAAIKAKKNPMDMVPEHIDTFRRQMKMLGFSYDWDRELATTEPSYYKWTQWLFIQFYKMGLLYKKNAPINFCPSCKTGLAEEEVLPNGTHERCGNKIEKKDLPQWLFKITSYADRLLEDLEGLDWPKGILEMQKNWIGRSEGIDFKHKVKDMDIEFEVFDSVPQTFMAQTYVVIAPEHLLVEKLVKGTEYEKPVMAFVEKIKRKKLDKNFDIEKEKEGIFTGRYSENYMGTGRDLPIWVASFVLVDYGTGIVGSSAHDVRDFEFAKKYDLPLHPVMFPSDPVVAEKVKNLEYCYHHAPEGILKEPTEFTGRRWDEVRQSIIDYIEKKGFGRKVVNYHLRDWIFSRQRYWGEPIPMIFCPKCAENQVQNSKFKIQNDNLKLQNNNNETMKQSNNDALGWLPVPDSELPLKLPYIKSYEPTETGESPLSQMSEWVNTKCPVCGGPAKRETDTMPNWAGSCWYFIAFSFWNQEKANSKLPITKNKQISNHKSQNTNSLEIKKMDIGNCLDTWDLEFGTLIKNWLPADWYIGGAEHAVLHLLYSRFWVKALYDLKLLDFKEPFLRLRNQGMILAEDHRKMSKSLGNVINPDDVVAEYGADTLRVYEMFMAPFNQEISWSTDALQGAYRFMYRIWKLFHEENKIGKDSNQEIISKLQETILKVSEDIPDVKFNTAIASMMEFLNEWEKQGNSLSKENAKKFIQILAPFAPFTTEELWNNVLGESTSVHISAWPSVDKEKIVKTIINIPVQVNGKVRTVLSIKYQEVSIKEEIIETALKDEKVKKYIEGKKYKAIYVEGKILNLVIQS